MSTEEGGECKVCNQSVLPLPVLVTFANAGLAGMCGTVFVQPMEVLKNRIQVNTKRTTIVETFRNIRDFEGFCKLYTGLGAGLVRQATYTTARLGLYNHFLDVYRERYPDNNPTFFVQAMIATSAGSIGAFIGTPADVIMIRMTSDARLPPEQRRNYTSMVNAFTRIVHEEGVSTLWRGSVATIARAVIVNISQLATYSQAKFVIVSKFKVEDGILLHFYSSMVSGIITAFSSTPSDIVKTRIQNLKGGKMPRIVSVLYDITKVEGVRALWKGFWPNYYKVGPQTVVTFMINEQFIKHYKNYFMHTCS